MSIVVILTILITYIILANGSFMIYLTVAIFGVIAFEAAGPLEPNIMSMYPRGPFILAGQGCLVTLVLLSYPLLVRPHA